MPKPVKIKTKSGIRYKADPIYKGKRLGSKRFDTALEANQYQYEMVARAQAAHDGGTIKGKLLKDAFERYSRDVTPGKRGAHWEKIRIQAFIRDPIARVPLELIKYEDIEEWISRRRDDGLKDSSISRELNIISSVIKRARKWRWTDRNPIEHADKPKPGESRWRRISNLEIKTLREEFGVDTELKTKTRETGLCWLFAIETGMRCSEITLSLKINRHSQHIHLPGKITKSGKPRDVPLSLEADALLELIPKHDGERIFTVGSASVDRFFRKIRDKCKIEDLHFHDSRHEAASRLAKVYTAMELCAIMGWSDPRMAMIYYNPTADELASKLRG